MSIVPINSSPLTTRNQLSRSEFCSESTIIIVAFLTINAVLAVIFFTLPNVFDLFLIIEATSRFPDLHHTFTCIQFVCSIASTFVSVASAWFCWKSILLPSAVAFLMIADSVARIFASLLLVIAFYCVFPKFLPSVSCIGLLNQLYVYAQIFFGPCLYISEYLQIALSLNRFLSLSYKGYYYHRVQKYHWFQVGIPCCLGFISYQWLDRIISPGEIVRGSKVVVPRHPCRIILVAGTISLDAMLIYKMIKTKREVDYASGQFLLAQLYHGLITIYLLRRDEKQVRSHT
ncbi:unnamed protein product, partial [Mesorhabditis belari]|uniref:Uncharacterized protein n=1 Tax=Mesorhabditis belari TaxID=2138241 RepID=A0AAF3FPR8_9BILA